MGPTRLENLNENLDKILLINTKKLVSLNQHPKKEEKNRYFSTINNKNCVEFDFTLKNCKRCGHKYNTGNRYCGNCGLKRAL